MERKMGAAAGMFNLRVNAVFPPAQPGTRGERGERVNVLAAGRLEQRTLPGGGNSSLSRKEFNLIGKFFSCVVPAWFLLWFPVPLGAEWGVEFL